VQPPDQDHASSLHEFVQEVQIFAGLVGLQATPRARLRQFRRLLDIAPKASHIECVISEWLISAALRRLYPALGLPDPQLGPGHLTISEIRVRFEWLEEARRRASTGHVARFLRVLHERHADPDVSATDIATELGLSTTHLSRLINHETGHGFKWHLRMRRLKHAADLLVSTRLTIAEVAQTCGFRRASEFNHVFKPVFGITPSTYRRRHVPPRRP
jgi:AraC-like DNA-binding protein